MRRNLLACLILIILSMWVSRDLLKPEFFVSHDGIFHVVRLDQFHKSLTSGQFPVRWAPDLMAGLGYPLFIVNYHLPYYLAEAWHLLGYSLFDSIKAIFILSVIFSSLTSWWLFYSWTKTSLPAFVGAVFYTLAPYRLANIFERAALGEAVAYVFVPLVFMGLDRLHKNQSIKLLSLSLAGLILSHTAMVIVFAPMFAAYLILMSGNLHRDLICTAKACALAFGISAFQLFPVIFERHYLKFDTNLLSAYQGHFKNLYQLLRIPHAGVNVGTRFQLGLAHSLVIIVSLFSVFKIQKKLRLFIIFSLTSLFLVTPLSKFLWDGIPFLPMVLYPWRFLGVVAFATAALAALLSKSSSHPLILNSLFIILVLFTTRHYTKVDKFISPILPKDSFSGNATTQNEFDPIWYQRQPPPQVRGYLDKIYFPGWELKINGQQIPVSPGPTGLIEAQTPDRISEFSLTFKETNLRKISNITSLLSVIIWFLI